MVWYVCELPTEKQEEIKAEVSQIYNDLGYKGKELESAIERCMDSKIRDVCDLIGWYKWKTDKENGISFWDNVEWVIEER